MIEFEFLILACPNKFNSSFQFVFLVNFNCHPHFAFISFQENIQQFIPKIERHLNAKGLVTPLAISFSDDV
jgi:hypothetical protein